MRHFKLTGKEAVKMQDEKLNNNQNVMTDKNGPR